MYEIHILENEEFDELPYKHARTSLGMSDHKTGKAYIRRTGISGLDAGTIRHEFDELLQKVSPHEEDGIRYKSGGGLGRILGPIIGTALSLINPALGVAVGAGISGGTSAHSRNVKPEKYGENTFGAFLKDAAIGGATSYGGGKLLSGGVQGFKGAAPGFFSKLGGAVGGATGLGAAGASPTAGALSSGAQSGTALSNAGQLASKGLGQGAVAGGITGGAFSAGANQAISKGATLAQRLSTGAKGLAKSAGTNLLINSLAPPQSTAITGVGNVGGAAQSSQGGQNLLGIFGNQGATGSTQESFKSPFSQEDLNQGIDKINLQSTRQTGNVFDTFRARQPGATIEGNSAFANQLGAISQGNTQNIGQFTQQTNDANEQAFNQFRFDGVKNANGLSDAKMKEYIRLSQQPDAAISAQFPGMSPTEFRNIFEGLSSFS